MMDRRRFLSTGAAATASIAAKTTALAQSSPVAEDYVALTHAFFDGMINPRNFSQPNSFLAADYTSINPSDPAGPDAAAQRLKTFFDVLDGYWTAPPIWTIDETIVQDNRVAVRGHLDGARKDPAKAGVLHFFGVLHFEGKLISTSSLLYDRSAL